MCSTRVLLLMRNTCLQTRVLIGVKHVFENLQHQLCRLGLLLLFIYLSNSYKFVHKK